MLSTSTAFALNLSRVKTWSSEILTAGDLNAEFDNILNHTIANADISSTAAIVGSKLDLAIPGVIGGTTPAAGSFTTMTINGATTIGDAVADTLQINANTINFEGNTADGFEQTLIIKSGADSNGVLLPTGAVFFMITGTCPTGTTDVSATYSNKFIKINATAGTSSGTVFTNTSDSTTLTAAQSGLPAHTHTVDSNVSGSSFGSNTLANTNSASDTPRTTSSTGGSAASSGHTHTGSSATTLEPSSVTMVLCQVD